MNVLRSVPKSRNFSSQALIYILAAAINAIIPFLLLPFLTRWLGPADFGQVGSFVALVAVLTPIISLNAHGLISIAYFDKGEESSREQATWAVLIVLAMSVICASASVAFREPLASLVEMDAAWLWAVVIAACGQGLLAVALTIAQTKGRAFTYGFIQIGYAILLFAGCLLLIGYLGFAWRGRLVAQLLAASIMAGLAITWLRRLGFITSPVRSEQLRRALRFGVPLLPHSLAGAFMLSTDRLILANVVSSAEVGAYYLAYQIAILLLVLAQALNQAWLPWLYARLARNDKSARQEVGKALLGIGAFFVTAAAGVVILAPVLVKVAGGPGFEQSVAPLRLLAPAMACHAWYVFVSGFLFYRGRTGVLSFITCLSAIVQIGLMGALIAYGVKGIASAVAITSLFYAMVTTYAALRAFLIQEPSAAIDLESIK
jgi:O-antigen/teichoic acid export membrane protein